MSPRYTWMLLTGCAEDPHDASSRINLALGSYTLDLDGITTVEGGGDLREVTTTTGPDCIGGVELSPGTQYGVILRHPAFRDTEPGTASVMLEGVLLRWTSADVVSNYGAPLEEQWTGTFVVSEWSDERVVLLLQDGERCALHEDPPAVDPMCVAAEGQLAIDRAQPWSASGGSASPLYRDVATGEQICSNNNGISEPEP